VAHLSLNDAICAALRAHAAAAPSGEFAKGGNGSAAGASGLLSPFFSLVSATVNRPSSRRSNVALESMAMAMAARFLL